MRAVVQRVCQAQVSVENECVGRIDSGLLVYLGVTTEDSDADVQWMAQKIAGLRIFSDKDGKMNRSVQDIQGGVLLVSQFTLCGDCRKGRRPGFDQAAAPTEANHLYQEVQQGLQGQGITVETGRFRTHMQVSSINDGPVTFLLDSQKQF